MHPTVSEATRLVRECVERADSRRASGDYPPPEKTREQEHQEIADDLRQNTDFYYDPDLKIIRAEPTACTSYDPDVHYPGHVRFTKRDYANGVHTIDAYLHAVLKAHGKRGNNRLEVEYELEE